MRGFNRSNTSAAPTAVACESCRTGWGVSRVVGSQSQTVDLGKGKEGLPVDIKIILAESWGWRHRRRSVCHNFQHMVSPHGPRMFKNTATATRIMHFLPIRKNQTLSRSDTPNQSHIMFLATTGCSSFTSSEGFGVGKPKPPSN